MEINDIHIYLRNPVDYSMGVAIYNHFGSSQVLKDNFSKFNNSFWREKLLAEIKKLATDHPEVKKIPAPKLPAVKKGSEFVHGKAVKREFIDLAKLPEELRDKFKQNGDNARAAEYLKRLLINSPPNKRLEIVAEIAALHDSTIANWADIDYYQEHKKHKEIKTPLEDKRLMPRIDPAKKHNQLQSWMSQRSKLKKKTDAASLDKIKDLTIKIDLLRKELA